MNTPFVLLGLAIVAVWLPRVPAGRGRTVPPWTVLYLAAVVLGTLNGVLDGRALAALAAFGALVWGSLRAPHAAARALLLVLAVAMALAFPAHAFPGFHDPLVTEEGHRVYMNFGTGTVGLFLLVAHARRITTRDEWRRAWRPLLLAAVATVAGVFGFSLAFGLMRVEPAWFALTPWVLAANLLFICVTEEALFRGVLQERLAHALQRRPAWRWLPVVVAAVLFGLAHAGKGPVVTGLATLAGLGYGAAYALTGRIEAAIAAHFAVNAVKHVGFASTA